MRMSVFKMSQNAVENCHQTFILIDFRPVWKRLHFEHIATRAQGMVLEMQVI